MTWEKYIAALRKSNNCDQWAAITEMAKSLDAAKVNLTDGAKQVLQADVEVKK